MVPEAEPQEQRVVPEAEPRAQRVVPEAEPREQRVVPEAEPRAQRVVPEAEPQEQRVVPEAEPQEQRVVPEAEPQEQRVVPEAEPQEQRVVPEAEPQEQRVVPEAEPRAQRVVPEAEPRVQRVVPEAEPQEQRVVPEAEPRAQRVVPEAEPRAQRVVPEAEPQEQRVVPEAEPQEQRVVPEAEPQAQRVVPEAEPRAQRVVPEAEPQEQRVVPEAEPRAQRVVPEAEPQAQRVVPEAEPQEQRVVPEAEPRVQRVVPEAEPQEQRVVPEAEPRAQRVVPEAEPTTGTTGGTGGGTTGTTGGTGGGTGTTEGAESSGDQTATGIAESRNFELLVEPYRNAIYSGEQTTISIDLHEFNPAGEKIQGFRQEVDINVTGIIDGTVSHKTGKIILDNIGIAWIEYRAGQQDKQIKITATFTPPGYPEKAKGEATINVKPLEYDATLTLKGSYDKTENSSFKQAMGWGDSEITHDLNENLEASIYVPLKMENAYDVEAQNLRYEYYRPLDINLSSFYASHRSKDFKSDISSDEGGKTTVLKNKIPSDQKVSLKETMLQLDIILTIDLKTDKVVKINMDGFTVEFIWKETVDTHHESWWKPPPAPGHETTDKTDSDTEDDNFCVCPVEDLIPDPIVTSSTEAIKKYLKDLGVALPENAELPEEEPLLIIAPDLLVKFGDGKTYFGGEGQKIIDNSEGSTIRLEKLSFSWQVTRKKKPL